MMNRLSPATRPLLALPLVVSLLACNGNSAGNDEPAACCAAGDHEHVATVLPDTSVYQLDS